MAEIGGSQGIGGRNSLETMYKGKSNSPQTVLSESISAEAAAIPVANINAFPESPNLATIGTGDNAEVIRYNGVEGSRLTGCERGFGLTVAGAWDAGSPVYRAYTAHDHDTFIANIEWLSNAKLDAAPHGSNHEAWGSDPIRIDVTQIENMPQEMPPTAHAASHGADGDDALTLTKAQISDFPAAMPPTAHATSHGADGDDALTLTKAQISDFPAAMPPTAHATSHGADGDDALTLTKAQISDFPNAMTPTAHAVSHGAGGEDALTLTKAQISDFPDAMTPTAHKNTHKVGGADALTAVDIGAVAGIIPGTNITTSVNAATGQVTINALGGSLTAFAATLQPGTAWNASTRQQAATVTGSSGKSNLIITPKMEQANSYEEWCNCGVRCVSRSGDALTFQCEAIPTVAIGVTILGA